MAMSLGLLKRNPALSPEMFSEYWYEHHAAIVVPYFLDTGISYYAQIHGPLSTTSPDSSTKEFVSEFSGGAEMTQSDVALFYSTLPSEPKWKKAYYEEVILVDEEKLLVSRASQHILPVTAVIGEVGGERRVIIRDGKSEIDVPEEVWAVWRSYESRGKQ